MPPNGNLHSRPNPQPYACQIDDNTTATFHSTASTTLNSTSHNAHRFAELEAAIKTNQSELKKMNTQYNTMETRILETMSSCHENSKQLVVMQGQLNKNLQTTLQVIAEQMNQITNHFGHSENSRDAETHALIPCEEEATTGH
jgi:predicted transcriptional regulator